MRFMKLQEGDLKQCCRLSLEIVCEIDDWLVFEGKYVLLWKNFMKSSIVDNTGFETRIL